jgi:hypothetical protein
MDISWTISGQFLDNCWTITCYAFDRWSGDVKNINCVITYLLSIAWPSLANRLPIACQLLKLSNRRRCSVGMRHPYGSELEYCPVLQMLTRRVLWTIQLIKRIDVWRPRCISLKLCPSSEPGVTVSTILDVVAHDPTISSPVVVFTPNRGCQWQNIRVPPAAVGLIDQMTRGTHPLRVQLSGTVAKVNEWRRPFLITFACHTWHVTEGFR